MEVPQLLIVSEHFGAATLETIGFFYITPDIGSDSGGAGVSRRRRVFT
jgi:hypothetical protein